MYDGYKPWDPVDNNDDRRTKLTLLSVHVGYIHVHLQQSPSIMDNTGTKNFVLYGEMSLAQWVTIDHTPLSIVVSYAGARVWTMKSVVLNQGHSYLDYIATVGR